MEDDIFVDMPPEETFTFKMISPEKLDALIEERDQLQERVAYLESVITQDGGVVADWYKRAVELGEENDRLKAAYTRLVERLKLATPQSLMEVMMRDEAEPRGGPEA